MRPMTAPVNTITTRGARYLLAWVSGAAVHLVAESGAGEKARSIVDDDGGARLNAAYAEGELREPGWHLRTMCGCDAWSMCPTDAGPAFEPSPYDAQLAYAPSCKRCLRILDGQFPSPEPDDLLPWNVVRCVEELEQWGCFVIDRVPSEQMGLLRGMVRAEARRRGWLFTSTAQDDRLIGASENSLSPERRRLVELDARERLEGLGVGGPLPPRPSWQISW